MAVFWAFLLSNERICMFLDGPAAETQLQVRRLGDLGERDLARGKPLLPKEKREGK